jgi:hypothetical protein
LLFHETQGRQQREHECGVYLLLFLQGLAVEFVILLSSSHQEIVGVRRNLIYDIFRNLMLLDFYRDQTVLIAYSV